MSTNQIRVDIVSDVVCPWCAIGYYQLAAAARETGTELDVHWHPFELNPQMADKGENLREHLAAKYGTTLKGSIEARAKLTQLGAELGFTFNYADDMRVWNTFRAHQLIEWADEHGRGHAMKLALLSAFFTDRKNISDIEVLVDLAAQAGLDRNDARQMLADGNHAQTVREKQQFWLERGIQGVPAMVFLGRHLVTGAQGVENYARILRQLTMSPAA